MRYIIKGFWVSFFISVFLFAHAGADRSIAFEDEFAKRYSSEIGYCSSLAEFVNNENEDVMREHTSYLPGIVVETDYFVVDSIELVVDGKFVWAKIDIKLKEEDAIIRPYDCLSKNDPFYTPLEAYTEPVCFFLVWIDGPHYGAGTQCALSASDDYKSMTFYETWVCCSSIDCECKQDDYLPVTITINLSRYENGTIELYWYKITVPYPLADGA